MPMSPLPHQRLPYQELPHHPRPEQPLPHHPLPAQPLPQQIPDQRPREEAPADSPLTVLVDDVRDFKDQRPARVARSSREALRLLDELEGVRIDHLWLDHDLTGEDTIDPVVDLLVHRARRGNPLNVGQIHIHTANIGAGLKMDVLLRAAGYPVHRSYALSMWTRWF